MESYSQKAALEIIDAYQGGEIDNSLDLLAYSGLAHVVSASRVEVVEAFYAQAQAELQDLHDDVPTAVIVTGSIAAGKSTYIGGLDDRRYYKPRGYRFSLPEYSAFGSYGRVTPARRFRAEGAMVSDHAATFVHAERLMLKQQAIRAAGRQACSIAIECHPRYEDIVDLVQTATASGLDTSIIGLDVPRTIVMARAVSRSAQTGRPMPAFRVLKTFHAMQTEWPKIATLGNAELISDE